MQAFHTRSRRTAITASGLFLLVSVLACSGCRFFDAIPFGPTGVRVGEDAQIMTPTNTEAATATHTAPPPTATEDLVKEETFEDEANDAYVCSTNEVVSDPAVDIRTLRIEVTEEGTYVYLTMAQAAELGLLDYSYSLQVRVGNPDDGYQVGILEVHAGSERRGRLATVEDVEPGTEGDVEQEEGYVRFFFPNYVPKIGDTLTARAFHLPESSDETRCDVTLEFLIGGLVEVQSTIPAATSTDQASVEPTSTDEYGGQ